MCGYMAIHKIYFINSLIPWRCICKCVSVYPKSTIVNIKLNCNGKCNYFGVFTFLKAAWRQSFSLLAASKCSANIQIWIYHFPLSKWSTNEVNDCLIPMATTPPTDISGNLPIHLGIRGISFASHYVGSHTQFHLIMYREDKSLIETTLIASFMGPARGPSGDDRTQGGPMLAPWTLLSGYAFT